MDYKVILSEAALDDLERIVRHIAADNPEAARRIGTALFDHAQTLSRLPHRGGNVRRRTGVKKIVLRPYLIFYQVHDNTCVVDVLRFWHGAQNPADLRLNS